MLIDRTVPLGIVNIFFRLATFFLAGATLSFEVSGDRFPWIMWRDATFLALTPLGLAALKGAGWMYTSHEQQRMLRHGESDRFGRPKFRATTTQQAYNIWRAMKLSTQVMLALVVFLLFGTIGPLSILMACLLLLFMLGGEGSHRARFETNVAIAQNIQESLLFSTTPRPPDDKLVVIVADVAGHPPLLLQSGDNASIRELRTVRLGLGLYEGALFSEIHVRRFTEGKTLVDDRTIASVKIT